MSMKWYILGALLIGAVAVLGLGGFFSAITGDFLQPGDVQRPGSSTGYWGAGNGSALSDEQSVAWASNQFGLDLYRALSASPGSRNENLFFSPYSISAVFALVYEGSRGKTAEEIQSVFHIPKNTTSLRLGYAGISGSLVDPRPASLSATNAFWAEKTYPFLPEYTSIAGKYYRVNVSSVDFIGHPEASRLAINRFVEESTDNRIHAILPPGTIDGWTRLVITNTIIFDGTWAKAFNRDETADAPFTTLSGDKKTVPLMARGDQDTYLGYYETRTYQALKLPYDEAGGRNLSMIVILPKSHDLNAVEKSLSVQEIAKIERSLSSQRIVVYLPKFSFESDIPRLPDFLGGLGMPTAFSADADLSGMDGTQYLFIRDAVHKATIKVNEAGTKATAATVAVVALKGGGEPRRYPVFRADHPFLFLITDRESGMIFFMGRVADPSTEGGLR